MKSKTISIFGTSLQSVALKFATMKKITMIFNIGYLSEEKILQYLYILLPYDNVRAILHIIRIINEETDDTTSSQQIFDNFKLYYLKYVENEIRSKITNESIVDFFSDRSIYSKLNILINDSAYIIDDRINFLIELKALNNFENYTIQEYKYEKYKIENGDYQTEKREENIEEIKDEYIKESLRIYLDVLHQDSIKNYLKHKYARRDISLTLIEKQNAILHTLNHIESKIENTENERYSIIINLENKIEKKGDNQQLKVFEKLLINAKVNYIVKDDNGQYFYPYLSDIIYHAYDLEKKFGVFSKLSRTKRKKEYYINKNENSDLLKIAIFYEDVKINNAWQYIIEFSLLESDASYESVKQLIKFIKYKKQNNYSQAFKNRIRNLPLTIAESNKFTSHISIVKKSQYQP